MSQNEITIRKPFDPHAHLRSGQMLRKVLSYTSCIFPRAVVMGNLENDPVDNAKRLVAYRDEILKADPGFEPVMSVMLTRNTTVESLDACWKAGAKVLKFIPGGVSTGGAEGLDLPDLKFQTHLLKKARNLGMIFSCHFELASDENGAAIPKGRQEYWAIGYLKEIIRAVPGLKIVVEHVSSEEMIEAVLEAPLNVAATLTAHHAILTVDDVLDSRENIINGLNYCKPVAKDIRDRHAVRLAMTGGNPKFFFGSDSAPHPLDRKLGSEPAAGIFTAPVALPLLCKIFIEENGIGWLENFVSVYGPQFYGLPVSEGTLTLGEEPWEVPFDLDGVPIFMGGKKLQWKVM